MKKIERAIISVTDKSGVVAFAKSLSKFGVHILSTGGTAKALREGGISVTDISEYTGSCQDAPSQSPWRPARHAG